MGKTMGEKIKFLRECLGMSQDELAEKLGYKSRSTINKIETGINHITQPKIEAYAKALETTPGHLMGLDEDKKNCPSATVAANEQFIQSYIDKDELIKKFVERIAILPDDVVRDVINFANFLIAKEKYKSKE